MSRGSFEADVLDLAFSTAPTTAPVRPDGSLWITIPDLPGNTGRPDGPYASRAFASRAARQLQIIDGGRGLPSGGPYSRGYRIVEVPSWPPLPGLVTAWPPLATPQEE